MDKVFFLVIAFAIAVSIGSMIVLVRKNRERRRLDENLKRGEIAEAYAKLIRAAFADSAGVRTGELAVYRTDFDQYESAALPLLASIYGTLSGSEDWSYEALAWVGEEIVSCVKRYPKHAKALEPFIERSLGFAADADIIITSRIIAAGGRTFVAFLLTLRAIMADDYRDLDVRESARSAMLALGARS